MTKYVLRRKASENDPTHYYAGLGIFPFARSGAQAMSLDMANYLKRIFREFHSDDLTVITYEEYQKEVGDEDNS